MRAAEDKSRGLSLTFARCRPGHGGLVLVYLYNSRRMLLWHSVLMSDLFW
jgi:hypothetical protein